MTSPRHLWSGDWEQESAAAAEDLQRRRVGAPAGEQPQPRPLPPPGPEPPRTPRPSVADDIRAALREIARRLRQAPARARALLARIPRARRATVTLAVVALALVGAVAYAALRPSDGTPTGIGSGIPWLGVKVSSTGVASFNNGGISGTTAVQGAGAVVASVVPGSPAARAGIQPGDVITEIGNQPVSRPSDVEALMAGRRPGDTVEIGIERGFQTMTTDATLQARPPGY